MVLKKIKDKIDRLKDNDFKRSVQNSLNKAKNIKDYYDILNKINERNLIIKKLMLLNLLMIYQIKIKRMIL
ncbi:hypothetical protein OM999_01110 [Mycoplasmopsis cynos]|uniref:hypothetical protein n=1 Tax=Mycoplasmopsis cynos TaxID=171284 RepID=UPI0024C83BB9|nr:hypothetical protein OM999_01110 [Mycoplasmopsis cynos]